MNKQLKEQKLQQKAASDARKQEAVAICKELNKLAWEEAQNAKAAAEAQNAANNSSSSSTKKKKGGGSLSKSNSKSSLTDAAEVAVSTSSGASTGKTPAVKPHSFEPSFTQTMTMIEDLVMLSNYDIAGIYACISQGIGQHMCNV